MTTRLGGEASWESTPFIRVSLDSNTSPRHFLPGADASRAVVGNLTVSFDLKWRSRHLPWRPLPDGDLVTVGQVDRRIEDDLVPVLYPRAKLDGRAEVA